MYAMSSKPLNLADGVYDVYMDAEQSEGFKNELDQRVRKIILCFTDRLDSITDGPSSITHGGIGRYVGVTGNFKGKMEFTTAHVSQGLPRQWYMEHALKFRFGKLYVEDGQATHLTIRQNSLNNMVKKKYQNDNYETVVKLDMDEPKGIFPLVDLKINYFTSEKEYTEAYLAAANKLNTVLFQPKPTTTSSSSEPSKPWREILGLQKSKKQPTDENPQQKQPNFFKQKIGKFFGGVSSNPVIKDN